MGLEAIARGRVVVLGMGSDLRGDDGAGSLVARRLSERHPGRAFDGGASPENFTGPVGRARPDTVILVDAADFGGEPGEVRTIDPGEAASGLPGPHAVSLGTFAAALSEETGATVRVVAVQAVASGLGDAMSPEVVAAVERLVGELGELLLREESVW